MNRIYRVIYNQAKNCYMVTSEFARAHTKSAGKATRGLVIAAMTAGALLSGAGMSFAALSTMAVDENNTLQKITSSVDADGNETTSVNPVDTLIINEDGTNAVTIDTTGLSVGTGTKMDVSGVYAGGSKVPMQRLH